jgi:FAD/FMN-containing dehydrogenase
MSDHLRASLAKVLGDERVWTDAPDASWARRAALGSSGPPRCVVRPHDTAECLLVARLAHEVGVRVVALGEASTFWQPQDVHECVVVDTRALRTPSRIDVERRFALVGAGVGVREIDRRARAEGLCVAAYPDTDGDTPIAGVLAVGSTAGLGLGRALPIELVLGATIVTADARLVRAGASHALGGPAFLAHGLPTMLGSLAGFQGAGAIVTEVALALHPVAHQAWTRVSVPELDPSWLDAARRALDRGVLDSLCIERSGAPGHERVEVFARTHSLIDGELASHALVEFLADAELSTGEIGHDTPASLRGEEPDYSRRWRLASGQHVRQLQSGAFLGVEVAVSWGPELRRALALLERTFAETSTHPSMVRRLALYPSDRSVSIGVQVMVPPAAIAAAQTVLRGPMAELLALGAVPYRPGALWAEALAGTAFERHVLSGYGIAPIGETCGGPHDAWARRRRDVIRRLLIAGAELGLDRQGDDALVFRRGAAEVTIVVQEPEVRPAFAAGHGVSLSYRVSGPVRGPDQQALRDALTELGAVLGDPMPSLDEQPDALIELACTRHVAIVEAGAQVDGTALPPCLELALRPRMPTARVEVQHPRPQPCRECGAATRCEASERPALMNNLRPLEPLRHADPRDASRIAVDRVTAELGSPDLGWRALWGVIDQLDEMTPASRRPPLELSLKCIGARPGARLSPRLRIINYPPAGVIVRPAPSVHAVRRDALLGALATHAGEAIAARARTFVATVERSLGGPVELSVGVDRSLLDGDEDARWQVYAHPEPEHVDAALAALAIMIPGAELDPLRSLVKRSESAHIALLAAAITEHTTTVKTYVRLAREQIDEATGLLARPFGALAPFAPNWGLAVFESADDRLVYRKWDFPCTVHFQRAKTLYDAFIRELAPEEATRAQAILDGRAFAAWPTWASVSTDGATLYFVPR